MFIPYGSHLLFQKITNLGEIPTVKKIFDDYERLFDNMSEHRLSPDSVFCLLPFKWQTTTHITIRNDTVRQQDVRDVQTNQFDCASYSVRNEGNSKIRLHFLDIASYMERIQEEDGIRLQKVQKRTIHPVSLEKSEPSRTPEEMNFRINNYTDSFHYSHWTEAALLEISKKLADSLEAQNPGLPASSETQNPELPI